MSVVSDTIARLEAGDKEHAAALEALKGLWAREDARIKGERMDVLAAFEQGARDREAAKRKLTEVPAAVTAPVQPVEAPRMSSLPATNWDGPTGGTEVVRGDDRPVNS